MSNPVLVEVLRGALGESRHSGAVAVVDAHGGKVLALGDVEQPVYPRSAVKALQALPLIETGAAERYGPRPQTPGRARSLWARPRRAGAGLCLALRRARPCSDGGAHAGTRRARRKCAQMRRAL